MNRKERIGNLSDMIATAIEGRLFTVWTALPVIIQSFDAEKMTVEVQPAITGFITQPDGSEKEVEFPVLLDVPVIFPSGGDFIMTFPIRKDDEGLVIFSNRCIDSWWQSGGVQSPAERRIFDLSDAFCLVGARSQPNVIPELSKEDVELRTSDGKSKIYMKPDQTIGALNEKLSLKLTPDGTIEYTGEKDLNFTVKGNAIVDITGDTTLTVEGNITADVKGDTSLTISGDLTGDVTGDTNLTIKGNLKADVTQSASVDCLSAKINAKTEAKIQSPMNTIGMGGEQPIVQCTFPCWITGAPHTNAVGNTKNTIVG